MSSCGDDSSGALCSSLKGGSDGVHTSNCSRGNVMLSQSTFDGAGARTSYAFVIVCGNGNSAHGTWSRTAGLTCIDGAYAVCEGGPCAPTSSTDCALSTNCAQLGECEYADGGCVLNDDGCARSEIPCGLSGACHLGADGKCTASSDSDCKGTCVGCSFKGPCVTSGKCFQENGACVAREDADCKKAEQCAFAGQCTLQGNACIASTDADCMASEVCRTAGQCSAIMGTCGVK
jgi:hypothetical protein